ncbi:transporter substrate-binding domain-containing protein [Desulforhopalus sp. IMCC35007]|uniref:transporter substrate-binding domain-containing protein n=1 Tax=Desulforhopalus sp. IMCC35007 TaxID=2569543 RepID=UPI0010AE6628|nr:transporter substrate-binding domain-containing protein [Desulforhopalus sp. IMCC35007]TKB09715.1 transporter substrate-binding domain-containing protein [Desulforhopalus sp. IMCC35007]
MMKKITKNPIIKVLVGFAVLAALMVPVAQAGEIRLGISPEPYMPFTQINSAGEWEGFEADLTNALCEKIGLECKISQSSWEGLIPSLTAGKIDFIVGAFSITDKRKEVVDFSLSYYDAITVLVGMKADSTKISDRKDGEGMVVDAASLKGKIIGYQSGTIQAAYAEKYLPKIDAKAYPGADTALADLTAGRLDYVLMDLQPVETFLASKEGGDYAVKHEVPANVVLGEGIGYAVRKGDKDSLDKIDGALTALKEDGSLDAMVDKWFFTVK